MIGRTLSHYKVLEKIGEGGMGEVYLAKDTKLDREVAVKVLPSAFSENKERLARFEREARLLASLNHPNIAAIHELEESDGVHFLALEYVPGATLAERIKRGPIAIDEALPLFKQIAEGLEAAHEKGVIHRDLKPANIKITPEGKVKVLDFGLAKAMAGETPTQQLSEPPTITRDATETGVLLGTAPYMSPEQARGKPVDKRTDIWAFGCCLYEALAGKPPFWGATVTDILASVVKSEPDWERLPPDTPFLVRRVMKRCLEKDTRERCRDIADGRMDLKDAPSAIAAVEAETKQAFSRLPYLALLGIAIFGLGVLVSSVLEPTTPELPVTRLEFETEPLFVNSWSVAFSRDGTKLAHGVRSPDGLRIDLRHMDRDRALPVSGTEPGKLPVFSPDGEWIVFVQSDKLKKIPTDGGDAVTLCDYEWGSSFGIDWKTDDRIFFADRDGLHVVPASGGEREPLEVSEAESDRVLLFPRRPDVLPGGNAVLLTVGDFPNGDATALHDVKTGRRWVLLEDAAAARYAPSGHIVFLRNDALHAVRFDSGRLAVEGNPVPILENIQTSLQTGSTQYAFSNTGSLAYVPRAREGFRRKLVWVDLEGNVEPIRSIPRRIAGPQISPDGESIVLTIFDGIRPGVWLTEASRETLAPLSPGEWAYAPSWSPNGERIAFVGMSAGRRTIFSKSVQSSARPELVAYGVHVASWAPNENLLAYMTVDMRGFYDMWTVSFDGERTPRPYLEGPYLEGTPDFSPDGRWIAYRSTESGRTQIYVQPFGQKGAKHQISTDGGSEPLWSPDGTEIFYRSGSMMKAVAIQTEPFFKASSPRVLFEGDYRRHDNAGGWVRNHDLSPDGTRFLMIQSEEEPPPPTKIKIILNWFKNSNASFPQTDMTLQPGTRLGHYEVTSLLGSGGMGEVYKAKDEHLSRDVAIKVLRTGTLVDEHARQRFRKEALALSRLNHPNIATVHDFDTQEDVDFIVMELVEGAPLAEKVKTGPLPEKEIYALGSQIAEALNEAHESGIVHRDLKPGNIAVTPKERVKVLDFGLARMLKPVSDEATTEALTQEHAVAGTLPYMSPEELQGEKADHRSDLFSFGVVLYEMTTGRRPFEHTISTALADAIIHKPPEPPSTHNRKIPPGLESIIIKALDKDPDHRYQSAREMRVDLERLSASVSGVVPRRKPLRAVRWLWAAAGIVAVTAAVFLLNVGGLRDRLVGKPGPRIGSIAVLPLENLSGDPEQEFFADGMTDELITNLAKIKALKVISRTTAMQFKDAKKPLNEIAELLDVDAIVEGSVLRFGNRVRINVQLIHAATDENLRAGSHEGDLRDILSLQREVARTIAQEIRVTLTAQDQELLAEARPVNRDAYEAYLRGRFFTDQFTPQGVQTAVEYFNQAIKFDPTCAPAYAGLAYAYNRHGTLMLLPAQEAYSRAKKEATKALEIDETLAEAHTALAWAKAQGDWDWKGAEQSYGRAIDLNPGDAFARWRYGQFLAIMGRTEESLAELRKAVDLDPLSPNTNTGLGMGLLFARQYDDSIEQLQKVLEMDAHFTLANILLSVNYTKKAMHPEAIAAASQAVRDTRRHPLFLAFLGAAYGLAGQRGEALAVLEELDEASTQGYVPPEAFVTVYGALGEMDRAFEWVDKALDEHSWGLMMVKKAPWTDPLRSDPRYQILLRRMNFPE